MSCHDGTCKYDQLSFWAEQEIESRDVEIKRLNEALDKIKSLLLRLSAGSFDDASEMEKSLLANQAWWIAEGVLSTS